MGLLPGCGLTLHLVLSILRGGGDTACRTVHCICRWMLSGGLCGTRGLAGGPDSWTRTGVTIRRGEFIMDNGRRTESVNASLAGQAEVSCEFQTSGDKLVIAKLKKLGAS